MQLLTTAMFTIVAFKTFKVNIKKLKQIKIKMSKKGLLLFWVRC